MHQLGRVCAYSPTAGSLQNPSSHGHTHDLQYKGDRHRTELKYFRIWHALVRNLGQDSLVRGRLNCPLDLVNRGSPVTIYVEVAH